MVVAVNKLTRNDLAKIYGRKSWDYQNPAKGNETYIVMQHLISADKNNDNNVTQQEWTEYKNKPGFAVVDPLFDPAKSYISENYEKLAKASTTDPNNPLMPYDKTIELSTLYKLSANDKDQKYISTKEVDDQIKKVEAEKKPEQNLFFNNMLNWIGLLMKMLFGEFPAKNYSF